MCYYPIVRLATKKFDFNTSEILISESKKGRYEPEVFEND
jgi:hypothetical protein